MNQYEEFVGITKYAVNKIGLTPNETDHFIRSLPDVFDRHSTCNFGSHAKRRLIANILNCRYDGPQKESLPYKWTKSVDTLILMILKLKGTQKELAECHDQLRSEYHKKGIYVLR